MHKAWILIAGVIFVCGPVTAQDEDFTKVQMKVTKVAGRVYMLEGAGGNIGASVGDDGIVIVDDQFAPLAEKIQAALKGITDKPVRFVINTHWHFDHVGGNAYFQKQGPVLAHENIRERMAKGATLLGNVVKPAEKDALPIITFNDTASVHLNGEEIRAVHFPKGHTDGDSVVFFTKSNVVHMGDDFVTYGFPFIDIDSGGSVRGMIGAIDELLPQIPPDAKIIPGHGPLSTVADLKKFRNRLDEIVALVARDLRQRK